MNILGQKPSIKLFVSATFILCLICGVYFAVLIKKNNITEATTEFHLSLANTPTPYPLPKKVYAPPSYLTTVLGQIFGNQDKVISPFEIIENGQKESGDEHLDLYIQNGYLPVDSQWWQQESHQVYEYVSRRLDTTTDEKAIVTFVPPETGDCALRGKTFHEQQPVILIFANQDTSKEQVLAVLAHELGHVFIHQKYESLSDTALNEGMATWAAGDYWKAWKGMDFNAGVRSYIVDKEYLPLFQNYDMSKAYDDVASCKHRAMLLTELASFIDYLIQSRGLEQLSALFNVQQPELVNNQSVVYPPNFKGVYGLELNQLEDEWLKALLYDSSQ